MSNWPTFIYVYHFFTHLTNKLQKGLLLQRKICTRRKYDLWYLCKQFFGLMCVQHNGRTNGRNGRPHISWWFKMFVPLVHFLLIFVMAVSCLSLRSQTQLLPSLYMSEGRQSIVPWYIFSYTCRTSQSCLTAAPPERENHQVCEKWSVNILALTEV